jgi:hypothetical protein
MFIRPQPLTPISRFCRLSGAVYSPLSSLPTDAVATNARDTSLAQRPSSAPMRTRRVAANV